FFKDCNNNVKCRESRLEAAREGAEEWTRWFKNTGMKIVIKTEEIATGEKIAPNSLFLKIKKRIVKKNSEIITIATFFESSRSIIYNGADFINQPEVFAHEIGHALGLDHSASKRSLMYYLWNDAAKHVYYRDAKEVCKLHLECSRLDLIISLKRIRPIMRMP
ncbi:MAG: matrixin family metalloprotease, partial [Patescibacteria group bacterium]